MAWLFELASECGANRKDAVAFGNHFDGKQWALCDGMRTTYRFYEATDVSMGDDGNWWCIVVPSGFSWRGITSQDDARQMTEMGFQLYEDLKSAPPFRFAAVGIEVLHFNDVEHLSEVVNIPGRMNGFVINTSLWEKYGRPASFVPFASGYWWEPYRGEIYRAPA